MLNHARMQSSIKYPCNATSDDYPVYAELQATIEALQPIQVQFHHILGHQDTKLDKLLTLHVKLNKECDAQPTTLTPYHDVTEQEPNHQC